MATVTQVVLSALPTVLYLFRVPAVTFVVVLHIIQGQ
jgi:hypothetical protein